MLLVDHWRSHSTLAPATSAPVIVLRSIEQRSIAPVHRLSRAATTTPSAGVLIVQWFVTMIADAIRPPAYHNRNVPPHHPNMRRDSPVFQSASPLIAVAARLRAAAGSNASPIGPRLDIASPQMPASLPCRRRVQVGFLPRSSHRFESANEARNPRSGGP
jgi:hypothetical protein